MQTELTICYVILTINYYICIFNQYQSIMRTLFVILGLLFNAATLCLAQKVQCTNFNDVYNFNFEKVENGTPLNWKKMGASNSSFSVDSVVKINGKYAAVIEVKNGRTNFGACGMTIPYSYDGKTITLSGYMKTENVIGSHAGLWIRLDPDAGFNNMGEQSIKGTHDWKKYSITLPYSPNKTQSIVVGGILVGSGKIWIDSLSVQIDDKDINDLKPHITAKLAAEQDNEFASFSSLTTQDINKLTNLELTNLGLIWGYLKYYHPAIQKGLYNWDAELFRIIGKLCKADNKKVKEDLLVKWIKSLGDFEVTNNLMDEKNIKITPDLDWITSSGFSSDLLNELKLLKHAKRENEGFYINFVENVGNAIFTNEHELNIEYPDAGYRLLALYRYWNIIQYFYPNRNLIGTNWKNVLEKSISKVVNAKDAETYALAILEVITQINDSHADLASALGQLNDFRGNRMASPIISFIEKKPIVTGFYNDSLKSLSPLQIGDEIVSVNDKAVTKIIKERWDRSPASNNPGKLKKIAEELLKCNAQKIAISFVRDNKVVKDSIITYSQDEIRRYFSFVQPMDTCFRMLGDSIAYVYIGNLKSATAMSIYNSIKQAKGLIIDFRCYPSDYNSSYVLASFLCPKPISFYNYSRGSAVSPGLFISQKGLEFAYANPDPYKRKVVVLVNEKTISASEFATLLFAEMDNVTIVGSTTAGADGNISRIPLPGGLITNISGIGIYYPNGDDTQRVGIKIDVKVEPTIKGIKRGKDEILEEAIHFISSKN